MIIAVTEIVTKLGAPSKSLTQVRHIEVLSLTIVSAYLIGVKRTHCTTFAPNAVTRDVGQTPELSQFCQRVI